MDAPRELRYSSEHCWVLVVGESGRVGVCPTWFANESEARTVSLPTLGSSVKLGEVVAVVGLGVEHREVRSPVSGSVVLVNERLLEDPSRMKSDPFGSGWLFEVQLSYDETLEHVMNAESYVRLFG